MMDLARLSKGPRNPYKLSNRYRIMLIEGVFKVGIGEDPVTRFITQRE